MTCFAPGFERRDGSAVAQALKARDYAKVSEVLDMLAWVGRDDSPVRRTLALGAASNGDVAVAVEQLKRHVELSPTVRGYGELAGIAVYLACDASSFHTGDTIRIDGGYATF